MDVGARPLRRKGAVAAIVVVAAGVRLLYLFTSAPSSLRALGLTDESYYILQANDIAKGHWFVQPLAPFLIGRFVPSVQHPPVYALLLSPVSLITSRSVRWHEVVGLVIGVALVPVIVALAVRLFGWAPALIAGLLAALHPRFIVNDTTLRAESVFAFVVAVLLLAVYSSREPWSLGRAGVLGLIVGVAALTRGEGILFFPFLLVPMALQGCNGDRRRALQRIAVSGLGVLVLVVPWVARNYAAFHRVVPISTNADFVVAGANCDVTYYGPLIGGWVPDCIKYANPVGNEAEQAAKSRRVAVTYAGKHLQRLPRIATMRVARVWSVFGVRQSMSLDSSEGRPHWGAVADYWSFWVLLPFAVLGFVELRRRRISLVPVLACVAVTTVTAATTWGDVRFRTSVEVVLVLLAGQGVWTCIGRLRSRGGEVPRRDTAPAAVS